MEIPPLCNGNLEYKPFGKPFTTPTIFEHSPQNSHSLAIILTQYQPTGDSRQQHGTEDGLKLETTGPSIHGRTDKLWSIHTPYTQRNVINPHECLSSFYTGVRPEIGQHKFTVSREVMKLLY